MATFAQLKKKFRNLGTRIAKDLDRKMSKTIKSGETEAKIEVPKLTKALMRSIRVVSSFRKDALVEKIVVKSPYAAVTHFGVLAGSAVAQKVGARPPTLFLTAGFDNKEKKILDDLADEVVKTIEKVF